VLSLVIVACNLRDNNLLLLLASLKAGANDSLISELLRLNGSLTVKSILSENIHRRANHYQSADNMGLKDIFKFILQK